MAHDEEERKRASLFDDAHPETNTESTSVALDLSGFAPKPAPTTDPNTLKSITESSGFTKKHAKKTNAAPKKIDGRTLKRSPRTSQFNVRLRPETSNRFWAGAEAEEMEYADDFLVHLLNLYEGRGD